MFGDEMSQEERDQIEKEREHLIETLNNCEMPDSERRFILKRIQHISEKLLEKVRK